MVRVDCHFRFDEKRAPERVRFRTWPWTNSRLIFLAIETTCDETGAAVLEGPRPPATGVPRVLSSVVASQASLHQRFGGVVPEIASRAHVQQVLPMIDEALRCAGVTLKDLGMIAVATRPGLVGAPWSA